MLRPRGSLFVTRGGQDRPSAFAGLLDQLADPGEFVLHDGHLRGDRLRRGVRLEEEREQHFAGRSVGDDPCKRAAGPIGSAEDVHGPGIPVAGHDDLRVPA